MFSEKNTQKCAFLASQNGEKLRVNLETKRPNWHFEHIMLINWKIWAFLLKYVLFIVKVAFFLILVAYGDYFFCAFVILRPNFFCRWIPIKALNFSLVQFWWQCAFQQYISTYFFQTTAKFNAYSQILELRRYM